MSRYVIKITRMLPESWLSGGGKEEHYFQKMTTRHDKEEHEGESSYDMIANLEYANRFTEQEFRVFVEKIKKIYKRDRESDIGTLLSIEVVDIKPFCPIVMIYKPGSEPEITISRFELMEL